MRFSNLVKLIEAEYTKINPHIHPKKGEMGEPIHIRTPHTPTPLEHWDDPKKHATVVPNGQMPPKLNGIPFSKWKNHPKTNDEWNNVDGQGDFDEPPLSKEHHGKPIATGVIIKEKDGRIWSPSPTNQFGGYESTIGAKGRVEKGINPRANAIKETKEETGLKVKLTGHAFDVPKTTTMTRYYYGERVGGHPGDMGWEMQAVHLVPREHLENHLNSPIDKKAAKEIK